MQVIDYGIVPAGSVFCVSVNLKVEADELRELRRKIDGALNRPVPMLPEHSPMLVDQLERSLAACGGSRGAA